MKRQRGRGRKPGGGGHHNQNHNQPNRAMESNGPDIKVRGPAAHIYERYLQLARDASSSGDRVMAENYQQHAEHYFRLWRQLQPAMPAPQPERFNGDAEYDSDDDGGGDQEHAEADARTGGGEQPDVEFAQAPAQPREGDDAGDGFRRGRRGRRGRYRPEGEREGEDVSAEGGERPAYAERPERPERPERSERPERRERAPREERGEERAAAERPERPERRERAPREERGEREGAEGFAVGPKPAFLRTD